MLATVISISNITFKIGDFVLKTNGMPEIKSNVFMYSTNRTV